MFATPFTDPLASMPHKTSEEGMEPELTHVSATATTATLRITSPAFLHRRARVRSTIGALHELLSISLFGGGAPVLQIIIPVLCCANVLASNRDEINSITASAKNPI